MSTRALQFDILLLGFRDPDTDAPLAFGVVNFLSAGTSSPLTVWDTKEKTGAKTSVTLDVNGQAQVYGDGVYKLEVLAVDTSAVSYSPRDNIKIRAVSTNVVETNTTYTATTDDDLILCDTSGGAVLINLYPAADFINSLTIKNISASGNMVTVDPSGSELVDGAATASLGDNQSQQYFSNGSGWFGAGISTGTTFTSTTLVSGTNNTFDELSGVTTVNVPDASNTTKGAIEIATDAEAVTGTSELLAINPLQLKTGLDSVETTTFVSTEVFTGASPTTYADLDLSSVVGAVSRMVYLKVTNGTTLANFYFRTNGETLDTAYDSSASLGSGASAGSISSGNILYVLVKTDSAGVIEWETSAASTTTTIDVEAYW